MNLNLTLGAAALAFAGLLSAATLPAPTNVRAVQPTPVSATKASFFIEFTPAPLDSKTVYTLYQFGVKPAYCEYPKTYPGASSFPTANFPGPPYRLQVTCKCGYTYTPYVTTSPLTIGGPRSAQVKGSPTPTACLK